MKDISIGFKNKNGAVIMGKIYQSGVDKYSFAGVMRQSETFDDRFTILGCDSIKEIKELLNNAGINK